MSGLLSEGRKTGSSASGLMRVSDTSFQGACATAWGLEPLEPRLLLSAVAPGQETIEPVSAAESEVVAAVVGNEVVFQEQTQFDNFFKPNVITFDFPVVTDAVNGRIDIAALSDLDSLAETVTFDAEGIVSVELFTTSDDGVRPFTTTINLSDLDLTALAADGNLHIEFTPSLSVDDFNNVSEFVTVGLTYEVPPTPIMLTPAAPLESGVYSGSVQAAIGNVTDLDRFTLQLESGQTIRIEGVPAFGLALNIDLLDPTGAVVATYSSTEEGLPILPQTVPLTLDGEYVLDVSSVGGLGDYTVNAFVNQAIEGESIGLGDNGLIAGAEVLDGQFLDVGGGARRAAVLGMPTSYAPTGHQVIAESFESGSLGSAWTTSSSTASGRIQVTSDFGADEGSFALWMDATTNTFTRNEAIWTVDLTDVPQPILSFAYARRNDRTHALPFDYVGSVNGDGVSVSDDGVTWRSILNSPTSTIWLPSSVDLAAVAASAGMTLGPDFRIKFQQYDNGTLTARGRGYDNIRIESNRPSSLLPDLYRFSMDQGEGATIRVVDPSGGPVAFELLNGVGFPLTSSGLGGQAGTAVLSDFHAPDAGSYIVRVTQGSEVYRLTVTVGATIEDEPDDLAQDALSIGRTGGVMGAVENAADVDFYEVPVIVGDVLTFQTFTRDDGASGLNTLDPLIELFDPNGASVALNDNGGPDGRNALISHTALQSGTYRIGVTGAGTTGAYLLSSSGHTGETDSPLIVNSASILEGELLSSLPNTVDIEFSNTPLRLTVTPNDLSLNGVAATSVTNTSGNIYRFGWPQSAGVEGLNTFTIAAGATQTLEGAQLQPFSRQFTLDLTPPRIIESSILQDDLLSVGDVTINVRFDKPIVSSLLGTGAHTALIGSTSGSVPEQSSSFDPVTNELTVTYSIIDEGIYTFTLNDVVGSSRIQDIAGNTLDGEANASTTIPSGNGAEGGDFVVNFFVDESLSEPTPVTLTPFDPVATFAQEGSFNGTSHFNGDEDRFGIDLSAGQVFSVQVPVVGFNQEMELELLDPNGLAIATSSAVNGDVMMLQSPSVTITGSYTILVRAVQIISLPGLPPGSIPGLSDYTGRVRINAVDESEALGGATNDDTATAQDLNPALVPLEDGIQQAVVIGSDSTTSDVYKISLEAGDDLSAVLSGGNDPTEIELLNPAGELITVGSGSWNDATGLITGFVTPADGDYFIRITNVAGSYTLITTLGAGFSPEPTSSSRVLELGPSGSTVGGISPSSSSPDIDTYTFEANAGDNLTLWTTTPGSGINTLDTYLELKGPDGFLLVESGTGGDGLNALINHSATEIGTYTARVLAQNDTTGGYILNVTGQTAAPSTFIVNNSNLADGAVLNNERTQLTINLNSTVRLDTLNAAEVMIDGIPALAVTAPIPTSLVFDLPTGFADGPHVLSIPAGALVNLAGTQLEAFTINYELDTVAPRVIGIDLQEGDIVAPGLTTVTIQFDEELSTGKLNTFGVNLYRSSSNQPITIDQFDYDPTTSSLRMSFNISEEGLHTLQLNSGTSRFVDLAGNQLDGEAPAGPIPPNVSGDGVAGGDFVIHFNVDRADPTPVNTPQRIAPLGSLAMQSLNNSGMINDEFDTDSFKLAIQAGQTLTAVLTTNTAGLNPTLTGPVGVATEHEQDEPIVLRYTHTGPAELIDLTIGADGTTEYKLDIYINSVLESHLLESTDPAGTAYNLNSALVGGYAPGIDIVTILGTGQPATTITSLNNLFSPRMTQITFTDMTTPTGDGTLTITAKGDLGDLDEFLSINGEGVYQADVFLADGGENTLVTTVLTIPHPELMTMAASGTISFTVVPSAMVGNFGDSELTFNLAYSGMPKPPADLYAIDLEANQAVSVIVQDINQSAGLFTVDLIDATTGVVVASGVSDGGFDSVIQAQSEPEAGRYHVRVNTPGVNDYSLTILRGAAFDIEVNDKPGDSLPSLDNIDAAQGYLRNLGGERLFTIGGFNQGNQILELDPQTLEIINSFPVDSNVGGGGFSGGGLTFDGDNIYVRSSSGLGVRALDPDIGAFRWEAIPPEGLPVRLSEFATYRGQGVVLDYDQSTNSNELVFFDIPTGEIIRRVQTDPLNVDNSSIAGASSRGSVFIFEFAAGPNVISEVDAETGRILNTFELSASVFSVPSIAFVGGRLYTTSSRFQSISVYDPDTGQLVQSLPTNQSSPLFNIQYLGGDGVAPIQEADRYTLNLVAGERVTFVTITPFDNPSGQLMNTLDPAIRMFDPSGAEVGFDDNSAADGKNAELSLTATLPGEYVVQVTAPSGTGEYVLRVNRTSFLIGDLTGDGFVGIEDLSIVLGNWNQTVPVGDQSQGDSSGDGFVGIEDLNAVLGNWNATLPDPVVEGDLTGDGFVGIEDLNLILGNWNTDGSADTRSDPTGDNFVGIEDLNLVLGNWNAGTPPTSSELTLMLQQSASQETVEVATTEQNVPPASPSRIAPTSSSVTDSTGPQRSTRARRLVPQSESALDAVTNDRPSNSSLNQGTLTAMAEWSRRQGPKRSVLGQDYTPWSLRGSTPAGLLGLWDDTEHIL